MGSRSIWKMVRCASSCSMKTINLILFCTFLCSHCLPQGGFPLCHLGKRSSVTSVDQQNTVQLKSACGFTNNERAYREIEKIMNLAGLPMTFTVCKVENIGNAYAAMDSDGVRFIVYDEQFLKNFDTDSSRIETVTALAHEIGHHLSGHTLMLGFQDYQTSLTKYCQVESKDFNKIRCNEVRSSYLNDCRLQELEADRFAGFIMFKYGATLPQTESLYYKMTSNYNDSLSDHPNLEKRLAAVEAGFELAKLYKGANITYVDLEKIKGRPIQFNLNDLSQVKRNILIEKVRNSIQQATAYLEDSSRGKAPSQQLLAFSGGPYINENQIIKYIGTKDNFWYIDKPTEYFALANYFMALRYDDRVKFSPQPAIHIKDGILKILVFGVQDNPKVVYHSPFKEEKISPEEIKVIFIEIFRNGMAKAIEKANRGGSF